jgi:hypothetical protein
MIIESVIKERIYINNIKKAFLVFAVAKSYKTQGSILILCECGHGQDALILARSLFELIVNTIYILNDPSDERISRYLEYDWVIKEKMYRGLKEIDEDYANRLVGSDESYLDSGLISSKASIAKNKFKYNRSGWSDKTMREMAKEVNLIGYYLSAYKLQSFLHHSNAASINSYLKEQGDSIEVDVGPSEELIEQGLNDAFIFLLIIFDKLNDEFKLKLDEVISDLQIRHKNLIEGGKEILNEKNGSEIRKGIINKPSYTAPSEESSGTSTSSDNSPSSNSDNK